MKGKKKHLVIMCVLVSLFLVGGILQPGCKKSDSGPASSQEEETDGQKWTCPDHPHIIDTRPVKCRTCGRELVPLETEESEVQR